MCENDDLRTALANLVAYRKRSYTERAMHAPAVRDLDALLAAHPAPEADGVHFSPYGSSMSSCGLTKPRDEQGFTDRRALTTCGACRETFAPAPPVEDGGWTVADWEEWAGEVAATLPEDCDGDEAQVEIIAKFVRRAAALPVVDEAEVVSLAGGEAKVRYGYPTARQVGKAFATAQQSAFIEGAVFAARLRGEAR